MTVYNKKSSLEHNALIYKFIEENKCNIGDKLSTHTLWNGTSNKIFKVSNEQYEYFLNLVTEEADKNFGKMHIMEKPLLNGPLYFDFDFKYKEKEGIEKIFNEDHIINIVAIITNTIKKNYKLNKSKDELNAYVLLKENPTKKGELYKDGLHIHYPNIILSVIDRYYMYDEILKKLISNKVFDNISKFLDNDISDIFDKSVLWTNRWFMFGSGKNINNVIQYYDLKYIIDSNMETVETEFERGELIKLLSIRKPNQTKMQSKHILTDKYTEIKSKYKINENGENYNFSNSSSILDNLMIKNNDYEVLEQTQQQLNEKINKIAKTETNKSVIAEKDNFELAKKLIKLLNKKRASEYNDWIIVGWTLYNISQKLYPEFVEFSKLDIQKFELESCKKIWMQCDLREKRNIDKGGSSGYSISSLHKWAQDDNIQEYKKIIQERVNKLLEDADTKTDYDVAKVLFEMYKHEFRCSSITHRSWWQFINHRWIKIDGAYTLSLKMSEEFAKDLALLSASYIINSTTEVGQKSDTLLKKSNNIVKLIQDLKKKTYKDRLIGECQNLFYDKEFMQNLDENHFLLGFDNGVYDLKNGIFRNGLPDDYISKSVGYDYVEYNKTDKVINEIMTFYQSILPEKDIRDYLLYYTSSLIDGYNKEQKLMFLTGPGGSNGKTTHIDLISRALGDYYSKLPVSVITEKRKSSSAATPELANKKGIRFIDLEEPECDDKINVGVMKELTGQNKIMARPLFEEPIEFMPQFQLCLICNELPKIPSSDGGTWRRVRVVPFEQQFVDKPEKPNQHKKDPHLREKLKNWIQPYMWLLINVYYPTYKQDSFSLDKIAPRKVTEHTNKYKEDSNFFLEFITDCAEIDETCSTDIDEIWNHFKLWYENAYDKKPPPQKKIKEFLKSNNYKMEKSKICGIRLKEFGTPTQSQLDL
jgi:P4 family phage/plasmid primase-like protien